MMQELPDSDPPMARKSKKLSNVLAFCLLAVPLLMVINDRMNHTDSMNKQSLRTLRIVSNTSSDSTTSSAPKVHYLSARFGNGPGISKAHEVEEHAEKVRNSSIFAEENLHFYTEFPDWILNDKRWFRHLVFLRNGSDTSSRGAGYWFWKPTLILHHLSLIRDGDFVVYSDSDHVDFLPWIEGLVQAMINRKADLAAEQFRFLEREWSKADSYAYISSCQPSDSAIRGKKDTSIAKVARRELFDINSDHSLQYDGAIVVARRNAKTLKFFQEWRDALQNYHLVSDEESVLPNAAGFQEHRHDQSFLSLLLKCKYKERKKQSFAHNITKDWWPTYTFTFQLDPNMDNSN